MSGQSIRNSSRMFPSSFRVYDSWNGFQYPVSKKGLVSVWVAETSTVWLSVDVMRAGRDGSDEQRLCESGTTETRGTKVIDIKRHPRGRVGLEMCEGTENM